MYSKVEDTRSPAVRGEQGDKSSDIKSGSVEKKRTQFVAKTTLYPVNQFNVKYTLYLDKIYICVIEDGAWSMQTFFVVQFNVLGHIWPWHIDMKNHVQHSCLSCGR